MELRQLGTLLDEEMPEELETLETGVELLLELLKLKLLLDFILVIQFGFF